MILIKKSETLSGLFFALIAVLVVIGLLFPTITKASENNVQAGELIITEIMQDPDELSDTNGEWFELYNTTTTPFDLNGCILRDNGSNSHTILGTVIVAPMSYAVLAVNAAALTTVSAAYDYSSFTLTNTDDEIIIECGGVEIDRVEYSSALGFPSPTGASMQLNDLSLDNNVGANWSVSTATWSGSTDKGTPGMANAIVVNPTPDPNATAIPTPSPTIAPTALPTIVPGTGVQITEIMADPAELSDTYGEWFEVYNPSSTDFDLNGCKIHDNGSNSHTIADSVIVPPMGYAVLAANAISLTTVTVAYDYASFTLSNSNDAIIIECNGMEIDRVEYDTTLGFPTVSSGTSMQLRDTTLDNNAGANWCLADAIWNGSADKGTPGMANVCAVVTPTPTPNATIVPTIAPTALPTIVPGTGVQITEIMADPAELSDTYGEWFEVYNPSSTDFDLNGCKIHDNGSNSHTIADSVIVPPMGYAVLAANAISLTTVTVAYDYASFTLSNSNDAIIIECNGMEIDRVEYDTALGFPTVTSGASMQLNRLTADNKIGANWSTATETWAGSTDMGTPAMSNNTQVGLPSAVALGSQKSNNFASTLLIATVTLLGMSSALLAQRKQR